MRPPIHLICFWCCLVGLPSLAQERVSVELLIPLSEQKAIDLSRRYPVQRAELECLAKPGQFGLFSFDVDHFEHVGEVTVTPFGTPIQMVSHGLERNPEWRTLFMRWHGELSYDESGGTVPVEWNIGIRAVDAGGNLKLADPNREVTLGAIQKEMHVVLVDSYNRLDETLVYSLGGNFLHLADRTLVLQTIGDRFEAVAVYEMDESKMPFFGDAVVLPDGTVSGEDDDSPRRAEQLRREEAYDACVERAGRKAGSRDNH